MTIYDKGFIFKLPINLIGIYVLGGANSVSFFMEKVPDVIRSLTGNEASFLMRCWESIPERELLVADDKKSGAIASNLYRKGLIEKKGKRNGKVAWLPSELTSNHINFIREITYFTMI